MFGAIGSMFMHYRNIQMNRLSSAFDLHHIIALIIALMFIWLLTSCSNDELPDWTKSGVRVNKIGIVKEVILEDNSLGVITDLNCRKIASEMDCYLDIAGTELALLNANQPNLTEKIPFLNKHDGFVVDTNFLDIEGDGIYEYLRKSGTIPTYDANEAVVLNAKGSELYKENLNGKYNSAFYADINGDYIFESIYHSQTSIETIDMSSNVSYSLPLMSGYIDIEVVKCFQDNNRHCFLNSTDKSFQLYDLYKGSMLELEGFYLHEVKGININIGENDVYYAISGQLWYQGGFVGIKNKSTAIYLFDINKDLVYHEVINGEGGPLLNIDKSNTINADFVLGVGSKLYGFSKNRASSIK